MLSYLLRRSVSALVLIFLVTTITFFFTRLVPGGPVTQAQNLKLNREQVEMLNRSYGLDRPLAEQYVRWMSNVLLRGDWGVSFSHNRPALKVLLEALPNSLLLGSAGLAIELVLGLVLGTLAAARAGRFVDNLVRGGALIFFSIPSFWLALMAILLFHSKLYLFPASGMSSLDAMQLSWSGRFFDRLWHLTLPALILGVPAGAALARYVRNSLLEALGAEHVRAARAKGLSYWQVLLRHGLRNSLGPVIQLLGLSLPALLNGVLIVEVVFGWPGIGRIMFQACMGRDYPLILAGTLYSALLVVLGSLLADLLHQRFDPRVRDAELAP
jgi:peptide/nickel transport system permease protein